MIQKTFSLKPLYLALLSIATATGICACSGEDVSNKRTIKEDVIGPECTDIATADINFTFKVLDLNGNAAIDAVVCVTPNKNSANCTGNIISTKTDMYGLAKVSLSRNILKDYRIAVQSPLYGGFDVFDPIDLLNTYELNAKNYSKHETNSINNDKLNSNNSVVNIEITAEPINDLVRLYMKHTQVDRAQAILDLSEILNTSPAYFEGMLKLNSSLAHYFSQVIGALNLPQRRLTPSILKNYLRESLNTVNQLINAHVPPHLAVLAVKRKNSKQHFPSFSEIKAQADKNKSIRSPVVPSGTYAERYAKSSLSKAVKFRGNELLLNSRIHINNKNFSNRSKRVNFCDPRNINLMDAYIWLFPNGQRANGNLVTINYPQDEVGAIEIDNLVCTHDAFGQICAQDTVTASIVDEKIITDDMLNRYVNSFTLTHRMIKKLENGASVVEFNITADPEFTTNLDGLFSVELYPGDGSGRVIPVKMNKGSAKVIYTYYQGARTLRAMINATSLIPNSVSGELFTHKDTDFVTQTAKSAIPEGTKLVAVQAGGCGRDRTQYFFKLINPHHKNFAENIRNERLTWQLGNDVKTSSDINTAVPLELGRIDLKNNSSLWPRYQVKVSVGREVFNYKLTEVINRKPGVCGPLDTIKLVLDDIAEDSFTAKVEYEHFDAWDALTNTKWFVNGQEIKGTGYLGRTLEAHELACGTTINLVAQGELLGQTRRYETAVNLVECSNGADPDTVNWIENAVLKTLVLEDGEVHFLIKSNSSKTLSAEVLENVTIEVNYGDGFTEILPFDQRFTHTYLVSGQNHVLVKLYYGNVTKEFRTNVRVKN